MAAKKDIEQKIWKPHEGSQMQFVSSNVDVAFYAGGVGCGKGFAIVSLMSEALMNDPLFRSLITRKSLQNQKAGGGFVEEFKKIFGDGDLCHVKMSDSPRISFDSGAFCDLTYLDDLNLDKLKERAKGWQYDLIAMDEMTEMPWEVFVYIQSRNRGGSKMFTGKFRGAFNPKRTHWTRMFVDWYIGPDGYVIPERNGWVRYFYNPGNDVKDVVWGDSKEEVYNRCRIQIDRALSKLNSGKRKFSYKDMIKSFALYVGDVSENDALMDGNAGYIGSVAMAGEKVSSQLLGVNFNVDPDEDEKIPIPQTKANECFTNDPAVNGDLWITADLADYGTDNTVMLAWNGFHVFNMETICKSTPRDNAMALKRFAQKHGIPDTHIIFDATAARYVLDYIPDAVPFISNTLARGMYGLGFVNMKSMCYKRMTYMIGRGQLTIAEEVGRKVYTHQNLKYTVTVQNEFVEECSVVRFEYQSNGKQSLWSKKKMNQMLGKDRSMDVLDPIMMRMYPCIDLEYGRELEAGREDATANETIGIGGGYGSVYDETVWY